MIAQSDKGAAEGLPWVPDMADVADDLAARGYRPSSLSIDSEGRGFLLTFVDFHRDAPANVPRTFDGGIVVAYTGRGREIRRYVAALPDVSGVVAPEVTPESDLGGAILARPSVPAADAVLGKTYRVLDHGHVRLIDYLGGDAAIVQAARVSYGAGTKRRSEDTALIRHLLRSRHTSPFEMCLAGDTLVPIMPAPGATQRSYTIRELAETFARGGKASAWVKLVKIRTVNPDGSISATRIKRAWKTGTRPVYRVTEASPLARAVVATDNHPFLTPSGYRCLGELRPGDAITLNGQAALDLPDVIELWNEGHNAKVIASQVGASAATVRRRLAAAGLSTKRRPGCFRKKVEDLTDPRWRARAYRHRHPRSRVCEVCGGPATDTHHRDKSPTNNAPDNLLIVCRPCHKALDGTSLQLKTYIGRIASVEYVGEVDVYDLEVESENHNFVADGYVVHNCEIKLHIKAPIFVARQWVRHRTAATSEVSARYSILPSEMYVPDDAQISFQSADNKQGRAVTGVPRGVRERVRELLLSGQREAYAGYQEMIDADIARELARIDLPVSIYTEWYWKINLHNLFHFLALRLDPHAQYEIRAYAEVVSSLVALVAPVAHQAFLDYQRDAVTLSSREAAIVGRALRGEPIRPEDWLGMGKRERAEFERQFGLSTPETGG